MSAWGNDTMVIVGFSIALSTVVLLAVFHHILPQLLKDWRASHTC